MGKDRPKNVHVSLVLTHNQAAVGGVEESVGLFRQSPYYSCTHGDAPALIPKTLIV